jgi:hypothetical protein
MIDDDRDWSPRDPAKLLPFVCELMPANPNAVLLPDSEKYLGEKASDGDRNERGSATRDWPLPIPHRMGIP